MLSRDRVTTDVRLPLIPDRDSMRLKTPHPSEFTARSSDPNMAVKYLLPCSCGKRLLVERSGAGGRIDCDCGAKIDVPTLRDLRNLESIETASTTPGWTRAQGSLFVLAIVLLAGGAFLTFKLIQSIPDSQLTGVPGVAADLDSRGDQLNAAETLQLWRFYRDTPDLMAELPEALEANRRRRWMMITVSWICGTLSAVGGLGCAAMSLRHPKQS